MEAKDPAVTNNPDDPKEPNSGDEPLPAEELSQKRMEISNMGSGHVPVSRVKSNTFKDPKNYREAIKDPRVKQWEEALRTEIDQNDTWEVIQNPREANLLHSKWVYRHKMHAGGTIERYKAKLVAHGDEQVYGVDYTYTNSAAMEMVSGKIILAVPKIWGVPAQHGDVPSAYVKAKKEDDLEVLLHIPQGMESDEMLLRRLRQETARAENQERPIRPHTVETAVELDAS